MGGQGQQNQKNSSDAKNVLVDGDDIDGNTYTTRNQQKVVDQAAGGENVSIEICVGLIANSIEKRVETIRPLLRSWGRCCIYRVHEKFHKMNERAYIPESVCIGPFHYKKESLIAMEECKLLYMHTLLSRTAQKKFKLEDLVHKYSSSSSSTKLEKRRVKSAIEIEEEEEEEGAAANATSNATLARVYVLKECVEAIKNIETKVRECYSEPFEHIQSKEFIEMMVVDGLFIIELFQRFAIKHKINMRNDPLFGKRWVLSSLTRDLLLLENQIPMLVLERLFALTSLEDELEGKSLNMLVLPFFNHLMPINQNVLDEMLHSNKYCEGANHLLDLLGKTLHAPLADRSIPKLIERLRKQSRHTVSNKLIITTKVNTVWKLFIRVITKLKLAIRNKVFLKILGKKKLGIEKDIHSSWKSIPSVTELRRAGVKFKKDSTKGCFLDIKFDDGILKIPPIIIEDKTDLLFRNLIASEQFSYGRFTYMTSYAFFMDSLINSAHDVELLCKKGIIINYLGSAEEVSNLFNKLCREIIIENFLYSQLCYQLNQYCKQRWHRWKATLKRDYFKNPWLILSVIAAVLIIVLTLMATLFSLLSFFIHKS